MQNPDRRASYRYRITIYTITWKTQRAKQKKYINSHSAKQNWKNKKNCYRYHSSSQRSLSPFWFQLLTIFSSFIGKYFYHRQLLVFRIVKIKNHSCHTDYQPHKPCDSQTWYILLFKLLSSLHVHPWHSDLSLRLWGPWSLNVLTISFVFLWVRGPAHYENTQCYFSVGLPKTLFRDFGLLYENDKGEYVVLNDVRMADIRVASLVNLLVYVSMYCEPIALLRQDKPFRILYLGHAQIITEHSF